MRKLIVCLTPYTACVDSDMNYLACTASAYISLKEKHIVPIAIDEYINESALSIFDTRLKSLFLVPSVPTDQNCITNDVQLNTSVIFMVPY